MIAGSRGEQYRLLLRAAATPSALLVLTVLLLLSGRTVLGALTATAAVGVSVAAAVAGRRRGARAVRTGDQPHATAAAAPDPANGAIDPPPGRRRDIRDQPTADQAAHQQTDQPRSARIAASARGGPPDTAPAAAQPGTATTDGQASQVTTPSARAGVSQVARRTLRGSVTDVLERCLLQPPTPVRHLDVDALLTADHTRPAATGLLPYAPRSMDITLAGALREQLAAERGGFLAVRAPHGAGLTRTLAEVLRSLDSAQPVLWVDRPGRRADTPAPLITLADAGMRALRALPAPPVIVIDPGHEHLSRGLTLPLLQGLSSSRPGTVVVVTLAEEHLAIPALVTDPTQAWLTRQIACHLPLVLDPAERAALPAEVSRHLDGGDPQLALGPQLMGTERARARIRALQTDRPAHARHLAIIALWQLAGAGAYVSVDIVEELALALGAAQTDPPPATVTAQLLDGEVPLRRSGVDHTRLSLASDLLLTAAAPLGSWPVSAFLAVAEAAGDPLRPHLARVLAAADRDDTAHAVLEGASRTASSALRARTALLTGVLEERRRDVSAAEASYRAGIACGDTPARPALQLHLAGLLEAGGALDQAALLYAEVVASADQIHAPQAALNLGWLREQQQETKPAMAAYRRAIAAGDPEATPAAAYNLAELLHRQRAHGEAERFYRLSAESGHPDITPIAHLGLGQLLERQQRHSEAEKAYEVAAGSPHDEAGRVARARLQQLRSRRAHARRVRR